MKGIISKESIGFDKSPDPNCKRKERIKLILMINFGDLKVLEYKKLSKVF